MRLPPGLQLLLYGLTPMRILMIMDKEANEGLDEAGIAAALKDGRRPCTLRDIENLRKQVNATTNLDTNDVLAVDLLVQQLRGIAGRDDYVLYYDRSEQGIQLAISTPFQRQMLEAFGQKLVFMDAVFGLTIYGYPMLTLLVQDDFGNGVPVAFCISDKENSAAWARFIDAACKVRIPRPVCALGCLLVCSFYAVHLL